MINHWKIGFQYGLQCALCGVYAISLNRGYWLVAVKINHLPPFSNWPFLLLSLSLSLFLSLFVTERLTSTNTNLISSHELVNNF